MKSTFKSFYKPQGNELKELWEDAIFVFDTNILTNLYRYQSKTTTDFLDILNKIQDKIWIPHHVALEYQRNRLLVIEEQHKKFAETKNTINSMVNELQQKLDHLQLRNRHSHIDPDPLIKGIESLKDDFFQNLDQLEKSSIQISSKDDIREKLDDLFEGKIGKAPTQDEIDKQEKEGEARFNLKIPPGYEDQHKDGSFSFNGVRYQNKFGDFFIWKQIIEHSNAFNIEHLIFVTDDTKKDWWEIVKGKKVGLRTELIDEIYSQSKVKLINVYQAHTFLSHVSQHLKTQTSDNSIQDVKLVSESKNTKKCIDLVNNPELSEQLELINNARVSEQMEQLGLIKNARVSEQIKQIEQFGLINNARVSEQLKQMEQLRLINNARVSEQMEQLGLINNARVSEQLKQMEQLGLINNAKVSEQMEQLGLINNAKVSEQLKRMKRISNNSLIRQHICHQKNTKDINEE